MILLIRKAAPLNPSGQFSAFFPAAHLASKTNPFMTKSEDAQSQKTKSDRAERIPHPRHIRFFSDP
jgi:hypothetical protein